ncbi:MAG: hypothetical protein DSY55_01315 [Clostridia bacterium]|nr:MAG: hypothetical protein DSY55_01315 [Clostridia bacterium]
MSIPPLAFHLKPPVVHTDRCLNARHRQAGCTRCVDSCPTDAISLMTGPRPLPTIETTACVGCGACIVACPTDAFSEALQPETKLLHLQEEFPADEAMGLTCPQQSAPDQTTAPIRYVIQHERCLAAFSPEQLLSLSVDGGREVWMDDTPCKDCPIGKLHEALLTNVAAANRLLTSFRRPQNIRLLTREPDIRQTTMHAVAVLQGAAPKVSRRGFFRSLGKLAKQRVDEAVQRAPMPLFSPGAPVDQRLPYHVPTSLQHLNEHLAQLAENAAVVPETGLETQGFPWADVRISSDQCSGCQLCARFCPTGALNYLWGESEGDTLFNITFHPALCLECNICIAVCPEDAVMLTKTVVINELTASEHKLLTAGYLVPCARCGTLTSPLPGEEALCYVCRAPTMYRQNTQRSYLAGLAQELDRMIEGDEDAK